MSTGTSGTEMPFSARKMRTRRGFGARPPSNSFIASSKCLCRRQQHTPPFMKSRRSPEPVEHPGDQVVLALGHPAMLDAPVARPLERPGPQPGATLARRLLGVGVIAIGDRPALLDLPPVEIDPAGRAGGAPSARPAGSISTGGRSRRAGRSPMATMPTPSKPPASVAQGCGPGRSSGRATGASSMAGWSRASTISSPRCSTGCGRSSAFHDCRPVLLFDGDLGGSDETVRWRTRAEPAPRPHLPGGEGHFGAAGAGRHGGARAQEGGDQLAQSADAAAGAGVRRRHHPHRDHRDLPLFRGTAAAAGAVRHRRARQGGGRDVAAAAWSSTCSPRSPPLSATSTRR